MALGVVEDDGDVASPARRLDGGVDTLNDVHGELPVCTRYVGVAKGIMGSGGEGGDGIGEVVSVVDMDNNG